MKYFAFDIVFADGKTKGVMASGPNSTLAMHSILVEYFDLPIRSISLCKF